MKVVFYVFNPTLVATNLAKAITYERMIMLWFMPVNVLLTYIIGSALGWVVIKITRVPYHLRSLIIGSCSAGNLGNLLLVIIPEVCKEKGSPFGEPDVCHTYGLAYASASMACSAIFLWIYVYNIVRLSASKSNNKVEVSVRGKSRTFSGNDLEVSQSCTEALLPSEECSTSEEYVDQCAITFHSSEENAKVSILVIFGRYLKKLTGMINLKRLLAPSTAGAVVGLLVGAVPQIRDWMIGENAPLRVIQDSAFLVGEGAIPSVTLILGANLTKGLKGSEIRASFIIGIIVVKYILLPISGVFVVKGAHHLGFVHSNPLYQFVLLLQFAVPPAMNIGTIAQLFGTGESECSVIMLWTYAFASVSLTLWSTFFMWLVA